MTNQYADEMRWVFNFEESEEASMTERGREFQMTGPMHRKDQYKEDSRLKLRYV